MRGYRNASDPRRHLERRTGPESYGTNSRFPGIVSLLFIVLLSGCASLPQTFRQSLTVIVPHRVDFAELEFYAMRSRAAYTSPSQIRRQFPRTTRVTTVRSADVLYFLETDPERKTQTLTIRGTADRPNVWQDVEIALIKDNILGVALAKGFRNDALKVHADIRPYLRKDHTIRVTGHSLGGAIAGIMAGYLSAQGFKVERLVTFGEPKVTDRNGKKLFERNMRITRVVLENDVVPMLPPSGFIFAEYEHFGPEVVLRDGRKYVYLPEHDSERLSIGDFWRNITDFSTKEHHINAYLDNIKSKVADGARQVPYFGPGTTSGLGVAESGVLTRSTLVRIARAP